MIPIKLVFEGAGNSKGALSKAQDLVDFLVNHPTKA